MENVVALPCKIQAALDEQSLRLDMASDIHKRRIALNISTQNMAEMLCCAEKHIKMLEEGLLFIQMPRLRIECLILLQRVEERREGNRFTDFRLI